MPALHASSPVAIIGAGAMGAGIAQVAAQAGHSVKLYDSRSGAASQAIDGIDQRLARLVDKGKLTTESRTATMARLQPANCLEELAVAGLVIEVIVENLDIKRDLLQKLEVICSPSCIIASNTSSLSITTLATNLKHPGRVAGMHFFNPAPLMALVEIVSGLATDKTVAHDLYETAKAWGKKPVHARSTPGFIVNRVARPFYAESFRLLQEGAADCATIDSLLRNAGGFRMGAFELTDLIGHDVNYAVTCSVFDAYYGDLRFQPSLMQKELVDAGHLGRKSGRGYYDYGPQAQQPEPAFLNSSTTVTNCLIEGHLAIAEPLVQRLIDAGMAVTRTAGSGVIRLGDTVVAVSDGRMASQRAMEDGHRDLVLLDLALDYAKADQLGIAWSAGISALARDQVVALLQCAGIVASPLADIPGLVVLRTVAMLANESADAVFHGVGSAKDIDLAMCAGVNYPRGPLEWADLLGLDTVLTILINLQAAYGEPRYRPSLLLKRHVAERRNFHE